MREQEQRRVDVVRAERAPERIPPAVVPLPLDRLGDPVALALPPAHRTAAHALVGERERAVERRPAHHRRVHEAGRPVPQLPDARVGLVPAGRRRVGQVADEAPHVVVGRVAAAVPAPGQERQLPQNVVLALDRGGVPDTHRSRAAEAGHVDLELQQPPFAAHAVGDLELVDMTGGAALDEAAEGVRLVVEAELRQRTRREGRVADPGEAVVPVPAAALDLGQ